MFGEHYFRPNPQGPCRLWIARQPFILLRQQYSNSIDFCVRSHSTQSVQETSSKTDSMFSALDGAVTDKSYLKAWQGCLGLYYVAVSKKPGTLCANLGPRHEFEVLVRLPACTAHRIVIDVWQGILPPQPFAQKLISERKSTQCGMIGLGSEIEQSTLQPRSELEIHNWSSGGLVPWVGVGLPWDSTRAWKCDAICICFKTLCEILIIHFLLRPLQTTMVMASQVDPGIEIGPIVSRKGFSLVVFVLEPISDERLEVLKAFGVKIMRADSLRGMKVGVSFTWPLTTAIFARLLPHISMDRLFGRNKMARSTRCLTRRQHISHSCLTVYASSFILVLMNLQSLPNSESVQLDVFKRPAQHWFGRKNGSKNYDGQEMTRQSVFRFPPVQNLVKNAKLANFRKSTCCHK